MIFTQGAFVIRLMMRVRLKLISLSVSCLVVVGCSHDDLTSEDFVRFEAYRGEVGIPELKVKDSSSLNRSSFLQSLEAVSSKPCRFKYKVFWNNSASLALQSTGKANGSVIIGGNDAFASIWMSEDVVEGDPAMRDECYFLDGEIRYVDREFLEERTLSIQALDLDFTDLFWPSSLPVLLPSKGIHPIEQILEFAKSREFGIEDALDKVIINFAEVHEQSESDEKVLFEYTVSFSKNTGSLLGVSWHRNQALIYKVEVENFELLKNVDKSDFVLKREAKDYVIFDYRLEEK
ncbi:MAG: hypothetical protein COA70_04760 [Planctomycetota bacterium]|nr:MAG: hypothetical protein COA70_04760 [Planctomycetota bacterium]